MASRRLVAGGKEPHLSPGTRIPLTTTTHNPAATTFDLEAVRAEFPILQQQVHGKPLIYLDSAATTQKPRCVIDAVRGYYERDNANVHRGVHTLSRRATDGYEQARDKVRSLLNAKDRAEIVFTRGTTEAINLVASAWGRTNLREGDEILITHMEHHSNIVPWQLICEQTGAELKVAPVTDAGELDPDGFKSLLSERTKLVACVHVSNTLGTINPVETLTRLAHEAGAVMLIDGAQAAPHLKIDVQAIGCDFYACSAHKMYGPTGIGALYGRKDLLEAMPPYQGGGEMIKSVTFEKTIYNDLPHKFEAGTPNIAGAIGFGAAVDFLNRIGLDRIAQHERELLEHGMSRLEKVEGLTQIGRAKEKAGAMSFILKGMHPYDVAPILDYAGLAVRDGHHCTQPLMERFGVAATLRASLGVYNRREDLDALVEAIERARKMLM